MKVNPLWFLGLLGLTIMIVLGLNLAYPGSLGTNDAKIQLAYGLAVLVMLTSGLAIASRTVLKNVIKSAMAWIAIALALVTLYTYQDGFDALAGNILATLDPAAPREETGSVTIRESSDGHFLATAEVDGVRVRFLVDTGASQVVLSRRDAKRIGIDVDELAYDLPVSTANGRTMVAPVRLGKIRIGSIEVRGVNAQVAGEGLDSSLLGMSYLRRLSGYEFSRRKLVLKE